MVFDYWFRGLSLFVERRVQFQYLSSGPQNIKEIMSFNWNVVDGISLFLQNR